MLSHFLLLLLYAPFNTCALLLLTFYRHVVSFVFLHLPTKVVPFFSNRFCCSFSFLRSFKFSALLLYCCVAPIVVVFHFNLYCLPFMPWHSIDVVANNFFTFCVFVVGCLLLFRKCHLSQHHFCSTYFYKSANKCSSATNSLICLGMRASNRKCRCTSMYCVGMYVCIYVGIQNTLRSMQVYVCALVAAYKRKVRLNYAICYSEVYINICTYIHTNTLVFYY